MGAAFGQSPIFPKYCSVLYFEGGNIFLEEKKKKEKEEKEENVWRR